MMIAGVTVMSMMMATKMCVCEMNGMIKITAVTI